MQDALTNEKPVGIRDSVAEALPTGTAVVNVPSPPEVRTGTGPIVVWPPAVGLLVTVNLKVSLSLMPVKLVMCLLIVKRPLPGGTMQSKALLLPPFPADGYEHALTSCAPTSLPLKEVSLNRSLLILIRSVASFAGVQEWYVGLNGSEAVTKSSLCAGSPVPLPKAPALIYCVTSAEAI